MKAKSKQWNSKVRSKNPKSICFLQTLSIIFFKKKNNQSQDQKKYSQLQISIFIIK